jgi:hypothetical protein
MPDFIPGLQLSEIFYTETVRPILDAHFPSLPHSAALIGPGSEVLGYDTPISTDHHWGPRLLLFLPSEDFDARMNDISRSLSEHLPRQVRGFSTHFGEPDEIGVRLPRESTSGPISHMVQIFTIRSFFESYLGMDPRHDLGPLDWLALPEQHLLTVTAGRVYHDGLGELHPIREKLRYYPSDVWLYILAAQWARIAEEEAFVGRAGDVGDELGSAVVAARLVRDIMRLCFLMERKYAPYSKWLGTAFSRLDAAPSLEPVLNGVLSSQTWRERESHLAEAYTALAHMHNALAITEPVDVVVSSYHERPYMVINAERIVRRIIAAVTDPTLKSLDPGIGSVDQWIDSTVVLSNAHLFRRGKVMLDKDHEPGSSSSLG